jgi:hypothetical protein
MQLHFALIDPDDLRASVPAARLVLDIVRGFVVHFVASPRLPQPSLLRKVRKIPYVIWH